MTTEERKLLTCQNCNETNDPGMLFCIHCGNGLTAAAEKIRSNTTMMGGKCPACGKQDDLNMRFCIFCASPMVLDQAARPLDKFSWEMELSDNGLKSKSVTSAALKFKDAVQKSPTKKAINYLPYGLAIGAALGLIALVTQAQDVVKRTYLSGAWPAKSLTVYTKHPFAEVTLYDPADAKVFTLAETDANGSVRFTNLSAGDYNIKITGKGLRTAFQQVTIDDEKPTVIGYGEDKRVELQRDPNSPDDVVPKPEPNNAPSATEPNATEPVPKTERPATEVTPATAETKAAGETDGKTSPSETPQTNSTPPETTESAESKTSAAQTESQSTGSTESKPSTDSGEKPKVE